MDNLAALNAFVRQGGSPELHNCGAAALRLGTVLLNAVEAH
jgi:hypothetical protein